MSDNTKDDCRRCLYGDDLNMSALMEHELVCAAKHFQSKVATFVINNQFADPVAIENRDVILDLFKYVDGTRDMLLRLVAHTYFTPKDLEDLIAEDKQRRDEQSGPHVLC